MSNFDNRYRRLIVFMLLGLQLTLLAIVGLIAEIGLLLALAYIGPIITFSAATYALSDLSSANKSSQHN